MGIAGMILGIIGLAFSLIPVFGVIISGPCVCVGLPLSGIAFFKSRKSKTSLLGIPFGISITGLATNIGAIVVINAWIILLMAWDVFGWDWIGPLMDSADSALSNWIY